MPEPRYKQYTNIKEKPDKPKREANSAFARGFITVLVTALIAIAGYKYIGLVPISKSTLKQSAPPSTIESIAGYGFNRYTLQNIHSNLLSVDLAWFHRSTLSPASNVGELDAKGFRPFLFADGGGKIIPVLGIDDDPSQNDSEFLLAILNPQSGSGMLLNRYTETVKNIFGEETPKRAENTITLNPQEFTSIYGQFLPQAPQFVEEYACFLANFWDAAIKGYIGLYRKTPASLDEVMDGLGLVPNPDCVWPFGEIGNTHASCEGGLVDKKIIYWRVTFAGGATRGQASYWDSYSSYDDPDTPRNITTKNGSSPVVDPGLLDGDFSVMFNMDIMKALLDNARVESDSENHAAAE